MRVGDKVWAMADNSMTEGECEIVGGFDWDGNRMNAKGDEIDDEGVISVVWDDGERSRINGWMWSFVPAVVDRHEEEDSPLY